MVVSCLALAALPASAAARPLSKPTTLHGVQLTEYFSVPESWFKGALVNTSGLPGRHRVDWLYSATGVSMEGDGIGLDGRHYHIDNLGAGGWVNAALQSTDASSGFSNGPPVWRSGGYWRNAHHQLTYPLQAGGWSNGAGVSAIAPPAGVSFAPGSSVPFSAYRTVAVDPSVIPLGSLLYIAAYRNTVGRGWFTAVDTGGAIVGRHVDVYRSPPASPTDPGNEYLNQVVTVYPPGTHIPSSAPPATHTSARGRHSALSGQGAGAAPKQSPVTQIAGGASPGA